MQTSKERIAQLDAAIRAQEALRPALGDAVVDVTLSALQAQLAALHLVKATHKAHTPIDADSLITQLQRYLPQELAGKMRALGRIEGERRQVTVMFADISEFTTMSERLDPEDVVALTNEVLKELAEAVYQYEGYIDKFVGDAVMAVFGAPVAHEDDPERALRAALAMRECMENCNRRWAERLGRSLILHIGINTGLVIAGNVGSDLRLSYSVMGDTVNTASRLRDSANPGQILVSQNTYRLTREAFTFLALEPIVVKGKREPLAVYDLQRARLLPGKVRGVHGLAQVFVGREHEQALLRNVVDNLSAGHGCIVTVTGEAGIGKSRLIAEWLANEAERALWLEGRAFVHTTSLSYGPFLDLLRRFAGIRDEDDEARVRTRLYATVERFFPGNTVAHALFVNLFALRLTPEETSLLSGLPPQGLRERLFGLLEELLVLLARQQPTVLVIDDAHWADATSIDLIEHLAALIDRVPLAMVVALRPNMSEAVSRLLTALEAHSRERCVAVALAPLSQSCGVEMAQRLLSMDDLPERLRALIVQKADGNPFFVEEIIRALIERGAIARYGPGDSWDMTPLIDTVSVPDTLQGMVMARLDRLPADTKWLVQQASVIGRVFFYRVLSQMAEGAATVDAHLGRLEREELIRVNGRRPEVEYIFSHALTQEVAYESLLGPRRRELHRRVGEAMVCVFAERLSEFQSIIGEHFLRGEAWDKAAHYLAQAGDAAARLYAHPEARLHYARALEALSHLPAAEEYRRLRVDLVTRYVSISWSAEPLDQSFARLLEVKAFLKRLPGPDGRPGSDRLRWATVHYWMGRIQYLRNLPQEAVVYYQQVLSVARELGDPELIAMPSSFIGQAIGVQGQFARAEPLLKRAIDPLERAANWQEWIRAVGFYGACLAAQGNHAAGVVEVQRVIRVAREKNFNVGVAMGHIYLAAISLFGGDLSAMLDASRRVIDLAHQTGDPLICYFGYGLRGWAEGRAGNYPAARSDLEHAQAIAHGIGTSVMLSDWFMAASAEIAVGEGRYADACALAEQLVQATETNGAIFAEGIAQRAWGQALAALNPPCWDEAEAHLAASVSALEMGNCRPESARSYLAWSAICRDRGAITSARQHATRAADLFAASSLDVELSRANAYISQLEASPLAMAF